MKARTERARGNLLFPGAFLFLAGLIAATPGRGGEYRAVADLNGTWETVSTRKDSNRPPKSGWTPAQVPGVVSGSGEGGPNYAWFRREINVPGEWAGRRVFLKLGGARWNARVYLDGRLLGSRPEGFSPFEIEFPDRIKPGRSYRLEIRCQDWSANFKRGFELPDPVEGDLRYAPKGQVIRPVGGHFSSFGLWDDVELQSRPAAHVKDLVIVTSHRKGFMSVRGGTDAAPSGARAGIEVLDGKETALTVLPAGLDSQGSFSFEVPFPDAKRWSPETPHLYTLRVTLSSPDGNPVDVFEARFGFKELWAKGPDFFFNGVKRHLLATSCWPATKPLTREQVREVLEQVKAGNNVAFRLHTQPWRKIWVDVADEVGVMIIMEAALWCDSGGAYAYKDPDFWKNYREHLKGMIERDRSNASLVMWSIENELLHCGCGRYDGKCEEKLADLGRYVKKLDPAHLITYESDHDPDGVADVIGLHYPREIPWNQDYPNTCDWLNEEVKTGTGGGIMGSREAWFKWERKKPLYIGEYLWVPTRNGAPGTVFFGDQAYANTDEYDQRAKVTAWGPQTVAYRRAGVSGLCPWTEFESGLSRFPLDLNPEKNELYQAQTAAYEPLAVFLREVDTRFFGGGKLVRTFDVFNDTVEERSVKLTWRLGKGRRKGSRALTLDPAGHASVTAEIALPSPRARERYDFTAELTESGKRVHGGSWRYSVEHRRNVKAPDGKRILLLDPSGTWAGKFTGAGLSVKRLASLAELGGADPDRDLVVAAPRALAGEGTGQTKLILVGDERDGLEHLVAFLRSGGRALVLAQDSLAALPFGLELVEHPATMTFALDAGHPVLEGLDAEDLTFWHPGNYVSHREIGRPGRGGAKAIAVSGGGNGVGQGPIMELPVGKGFAIFCQALIGEKLESEPVARVLLENSLAWLADYEPPAGRAVVLSGDEGFVRRLKGLGVEFSTSAADLDRARLAVLHGGGAAIASSVAALKAFAARKGNTLYWHAPEEKTFAGVVADLGARDLEVGPAQGPLALRLPEHPALAGVAREDLVFRGRSRGPSWMGATDPDPSIIDRAVRPKIGPGGSVRLDVRKWKLEGRSVTLSEDGKQVEFYTNGSASGEVTTSRAGLYAVTVVAGGTPTKGGYPLVHLLVGEKLVGQVHLDSGEMGSYTTLAELPKGTFSLKAAFVNDDYTGKEDRNLFLKEIRLSRKPWKGSDVEFLSLPGALAAVPVGEGRLIVDCVRWDTNEANRARGERFASVLLRNLGASFTAPALAASWLPAKRFKKVKGGEFFFVGGDEIRYHSPGEASCEFECVAAGEYVIIVRGRSDPAEGEYGKALVKVDGKDVGEVEVVSRSLQEFALASAVDLSKGKHTVAVEFTNDKNVPPEDRNLFISAVGLARKK